MQIFKAVNSHTKMFTNENYPLYTVYNVLYDHVDLAGKSFANEPNQQKI